jgi:hypothetical protein
LHNLSQPKYARLAAAVTADIVLFLDALGDGGIRVDLW